MMTNNVNDDTIAERTLDIEGLFNGFVQSEGQPAAISRLAQHAATLELENIQMRDGIMDALNVSDLPDEARKALDGALYGETTKLSIEEVDRDA